MGGVYGMPRGEFTPWIDREFWWSGRTARRFMQVAAACRQHGQLGQFGPIALYALAEPSVPTEVRADFIFWIKWTRSHSNPR